MQFVTEDYAVCDRRFVKEWEYLWKKLLQSPINSSDLEKFIKKYQGIVSKCGFHQKNYIEEFEIY